MNWCFADLWVVENRVRLHFEVELEPSLGAWWGTRNELRPALVPVTRGKGTCELA